MHCSAKYLAIDDAYTHMIDMNGFNFLNVYNNTPSTSYWAVSCVGVWQKTSVCVWTWPHLFFVRLLHLQTEDWRLKTLIFVHPLSACTLEIGHGVRPLASTTTVDLYHYPPRWLLLRIPYTSLKITIVLLVGTQYNSGGLPNPAKAVREKWKQKTI